MESIDILTKTINNDKLVLNDIGDLQESPSPYLNRRYSNGPGSASSGRYTGSPQKSIRSDGDDVSISMDSELYYQSEGPDSVSKSPSKGKWSPEEDDMLREAVEKYGGKNWKKISDLLAGRTDVQCLHRWQKVLRPGLVKGPWTPEVSS